MLFLIPVGGGIPAGVLLARTNGLAWPVTAGLYLVSDILLAFAFEPVLQFLAWVAGNISFLARFGARMKAAMAKHAERFTGTGAGPLTLIVISFGADPMTGRASAMAAGHGFVMGWIFAISGDLLYFAVIAVTTLRLSSYFRDPGTVEWIVLGAMISVPLIIRFVKRTFRADPHASGEA